MTNEQIAEVFNSAAGPLVEFKAASRYNKKDYGGDDEEVIEIQFYIPSIEKKGVCGASIGDDEKHAAFRAAESARRYAEHHIAKAKQ